MLTPEIREMRRLWPSSAKTAVSRSGPTAPARRLHQAGRIEHPSLDYGCGRSIDGELYGMWKWDPYYHPNKLARTYWRNRCMTILCTYVLNTLSVAESEHVLRNIKRLLAPGGTAYITVRRDLKEDVFNKDGTIRQRRVTLDLPVFYENRSYCIYMLRKRSRKPRHPDGL